MIPVIESIHRNFGPLASWLFASFLIFLRYALPAALVFWLLYRRYLKSWIARKIQARMPADAQIRSEIVHSAYTSLIFGAMALGVYFLRMQGYGKLYFQISEYGPGYYFASILILIIAHDTYFYWIHRLMHHPFLFKRFHLTHHQSVNPTPFTAFSFHPVESVLEFGIIPLAALLIPVHTSALFLFTVWSITLNIFGHTGFEFSPSGFTRHRIFKWMNTPTHHNMHHSRSHCNYSLYFNFWDRLMGTNHPEYDEYFEKVISKKRSV